jgi:hypothetical protein
MLELIRYEQEKEKGQKNPVPVETEVYHEVLYGAYVL